MSLVTFSLLTSDVQNKITYNVKEQFSNAKQVVNSIVLLVLQTEPETEPEVITKAIENKDKCQKDSIRTRSR